MKTEEPFATSSSENYKDQSLMVFFRVVKKINNIYAEEKYGKYFEQETKTEYEQNNADFKNEKETIQLKESEIENLTNNLTSLKPVKNVYKDKLKSSLKSKFQLKLNN